MNQNNRYHDTNRCSFPTAFPPQHQDEQPGLEYIMKPPPMSKCCKSHRKLENKVALITGGDSGIGRAIAYDFVKEGAKAAIVYFDEDRDANETAAKIKELGGECLLLRGDLKNPHFAKECADKTVRCFGTIDILVNNHAAQSRDPQSAPQPHQ